MGKVLVEREQFKEAAELLAPLVEAVPTPDPWLLRSYALALSHTGETERAVALARKAAAMLPDRSMYSALAVVHYRSGDIPAADEAMKNHVERYPRRGEPQSLFLDSVKAEPNVDEGIRRYEDVMAAALVYPNHRLQQAITYAYAGKSEASIPILEELVGTAPLRYRAEALRRLGEHYRSGWAGVQAQPDNAQSLLREAAELGDAAAAASLAFDFYDYPQRGDREPAEAYHFYQMAVRRGHLQSLRNLGIMYRSGRGIPKDPEKALVLYLKVMQTGCPIAHNNAAWLLLHERRMWDEEAPRTEYFEMTHGAAGCYTRPNMQHEAFSKHGGRERAPVPPVQGSTGGADRLLFRKILGFAGLSLLFALAGWYSPLRELWGTDDGLEAVRRLGAWGVLIVIAAGSIAPFALLPRWPIAVGCGLLYGLGWGGLLANTASTLGAWLQFRFARRSLSATAERLLSRFGRRRIDLSPRQSLTLLLALRAFPLSNFVATNLLSASLNLSPRSYVLGTFLGMIPSTLMYGAWGHMAARPGSGSYLLGGILLGVAVLSGALAKRRLPSGMPGSPENNR